MTAGTGESLTVFVSHSFADGQERVQTWADFFAGLLHGSELASLTAYIATLEEVHRACGEQSLGCYSSNTIVSLGESIADVDPAGVAAHEYGHHVAMNRDNFPWSAVNTGTKRWASANNVCLRAATGELYPGDEGDHYGSNPGEGFAEAYRAVNEAKKGASSFSWPIVDWTFYPDLADLQMVEQDVLQPWSAPPPRTVRGRFVASGKKTWTLGIPTPLDGLLTARLSLPAGSLYALSLLGPGGKPVLAKGQWSSASAKSLSFTVCGQRSVTIRVVRVGPAGRFSLTLTAP